MYAFVKKSVSVVIMMMIATLVAVMPAFAGGPSDGFSEILELKVLANGMPLERNTFSGKYWVKPGTILTFSPLFTGDKGQVVPPPVSKLGWDISVVGAPGVVTPFRGGNNQKNHWPMYRANKAGFIYVTGSAFSGDSAIELHRVAAETIVVSTAPAPAVSLDFSVASHENTIDRMMVGIKTNTTLTNVRMEVRQNEPWPWLISIYIHSDQGHTSITYPKWTGIYYQYIPGTTRIWWTSLGWSSLPDGIMSNSGLKLPTIRPDRGEPVKIEWLVETGKG